MDDYLEFNKVHCRTGSLEKQGITTNPGFEVHCRTGSLEIYVQMAGRGMRVHCRTGSLEKLGDSTDSGT